MIKAVEPKHDILIQFIIIARVSEINIFIRERSLLIFRHF